MAFFNKLSQVRPAECRSRIDRSGGSGSSSDAAEPMPSLGELIEKTRAGWPAPSRA
jgi:hypothetical protein